ncbi:MAG TPA: M1 family aminopeptidase [Candidatus Krumholzibacteria bacterium]|nr:M1 family aminopeptidase [Candidatus Krumholzibacteria bacterium]
MSIARLSASFSVEFWHSFRRPLFIALTLMLLLTAFGLSSGKMQISSGDSSVGGTKAFITSEFAQTQTTTFLVLLYYAFFVAAAAGLSLLRDRETRVDVLLHSTPMTPDEYVWGRFFAVVGSFAVLLCWQASADAFFNHAVPNANANDMRGPFSFYNYFMPVLSMGIPFIVFFAGISMWVGERSRSSVLVFVLPVAMLMVSGFFLWTWSPSWLSWRVNQILQVIEPTGYRWLNETYLKVDRGVEFYNHARVPYVGLFWLNRLWLVGMGLVGVVMTRRSVAQSMRGAVAAKPGFWRRRRAAAAVAVPAAAQEYSALRTLGMTTGVPSFLASVRDVARAELHELMRQAGLYIFVPLILIQCLGNALVAVGAFDTPVLLTPGSTAAGAANQLVTFVCFLLMFYTVESLEREKATGFAPILYASPLRTAAFLTGKAAANGVIALAVLLAALIACVIALLVQHTVPFSLAPYVLIWGLLLIPTFLAWTAFVTAMYAVSGNRYAAYALSFGLLAFSGYKAMTGGMSWAGNWPLWDAIRWSDLGFFETDRKALLLNRVMVLGFAVLFTVVAVRLFGRRGSDAVRTMHRLAPARLARSTVRLFPFAAVPLTACALLVFMVHSGLEGGVAKKAGKEYWAKNLKTWFDAPVPDIARANIDVKVDPSRHWIASSGTFTLVNPLDSAMTRIPLTIGLFWKNVKWTLDGADYTPEDSRYLMVFTPSHPLAQGDSVVIGWSFEGRFPGGVTKNGGNTSEFILPSGVVLTGFEPSFAPVLGFQEQVGETKDNHTEPRRYPRDYWKGVTRGGYGATAWFPARISVTGPQEYTLNSVGVCTSNTVSDGWRTQVWETDHPAKILNIVCGRWEEKRGQRGTVVYYNEKHPYNVDEMVSTLDAARQWYSEWFLPYPWQELKLSEFPGLAGYAQGFGTDITFSENIGFLTKNDAKTDATFLVTAHETAHQWWGNILTPANGPNGDFLSEGTAHFSTLLLFEQMKGPRGRMEFAKGIEDRYNNRRRPNDERPMYDVDGKRRSDTTVIYDRGGWVFWMVYDYIGHERALEGYRNFFRTWSASRDHPALQDFVAAMRPYAEDPDAYDAFTKQWFEDKVVPQYVVRGAKKQADGDGFAVTLTLENIGTGLMPVEVAVTKGERWQKPSDGDTRGAYTQREDYRDARSTVTIGSGESKDVTIRCDFDPDKIVVDPDVRILQLKRKQAVASL